MPRKYEEQNENEKAGADEDLDQRQNGNEPVEKRFSPNPVGDHANDRNWFEDGQHEIYDVGIVQLIVIGQPAAGNEIPIHGDSSDHVNERKQCRFHVMPVRLGLSVVLCLTKATTNGAMAKQTRLHFRSPQSNVAP
jgi:hypothetical protein